ncbi:hypothetical protein SAMN02745181_1196 [Rubritalea squalenifaciens DSM 18772]|uniref:HEAT repeat-containing protein n=2 Tax=Rubritalea squalenifaciens TaxID=407226 RepID=A0A1M6GKV1_9BACT|nr:hypothetical protein SAMN02745181_1196 [Rubritalea squalenifaciens DSM 18772]
MRVFATLILLLSTLCQAKIAPLCEKFMNSQGVYHLSIDNSQQLGVAVVYKDKVGIPWDGDGDGPRMSRVFASRLDWPKIELTGPKEAKVKPGGKEPIVLGFVTYHGQEKDWTAEVWWCYEDYIYKYASHQAKWVQVGVYPSKDILVDLKWLDTNHENLKKVIIGEGCPSDFGIKKDKLKALVEQGFMNWLPAMVKLGEGKVANDGELLAVALIREFMEVVPLEKGEVKADDESLLECYVNLLRALKMVEEDQEVTSKLDPKQLEVFYTSIDKLVRSFRESSITPSMYSLYEDYKVRLYQRLLQQDPEVDLLQEVQVALHHFDAEGAPRLYGTYLAGLKGEKGYSSANHERLSRALKHLQSVESIEKPNGYTVMPAIEAFYEEIDTEVLSYQHKKLSPSQQLLFNDYCRREKDKLLESGEMSDIIDFMRLVLRQEKAKEVEFLLNLFSVRKHVGDLQLLGELLDSDYVKNQGVVAVKPVLEHMGKRKEKEVVWLVSSLLEHKDEKVQKIAHDFLVERVGVDHGKTVKAWRDWYNQE